MSDNEEEMKRLRESRKYRESDAYARAQDLAAAAESSAAFAGMPMSFGKKKKKKRPAPAPAAPTAPSSGGGAPSLGDLVSAYRSDVAASGAAGGSSGSPAGGGAEEVGPAPPPAARVAGEDKLPLGMEAVLSKHARTVCALALDKSGSRLLSGGFDFDLHMWDFAAMNRAMRPFRTLQPCESHQIKSIDYSPTGSMFVVAGGDAQARVFDRDGHKICEFAKGYQYLADMKNTKGHVSFLSNAVFHPYHKRTVLTGSADGTFRVWKVDDAAGTGTQETVVKIKKRNGQRSAVSHAIYAMDGKTVACAGQDGSLFLFETKRFKRPETVWGAHAVGSDVSGLAFSRDGHTLLSRACDDTLKVWDVRKFRKPLHVLSGLDSNQSELNVVFSPTGEFAATGTCVRPGSSDKSRLCIFNTTTWELVRSVNIVAGASAVATLWHPRLNQIFVGCSDGSIHGFFDDAKSTNGLLLCANKRVREREPTEFVSPDLLPTEYNPHAQRKVSRKKMEKMRQGSATRMPSRPQGLGVGVGGRIGGSETAYMMQKLYKRDVKAEDPRAELLKYAEAAKEEAVFTAAYSKTQPKAVYDTSYMDEEGGGSEQKAKRQKTADQ